MGTSHTERDSVEADKIRLKPNNNGKNSNKENHRNQGMTKIIIIMGGEARGTQTHTNAPLQRSVNHTLKYCQGARVMSRPLTVAKG